MKNKIIAIIKNVALKQKIKINLNDANLDKPFKEMGVDSIYVFGIIVAIENELNCKLDDSKLMNVKTINQLIAAFESAKK